MAKVNCKITGKISKMDYKEDLLLIEGNNLEISDSYHTIVELYSHRILLFISLMKCNKEISWKSKFHSDGSSYDDWFIAGMELPTGQITYHIPMEFWWEKLEDIKTLEKSPEWDGHTSNDVLKRLNDWSILL